VANILIDQIDSNDLQGFKVAQAKVMAEVMHAVTKSDIEVTIKSASNTYTSKQRGALHVWCEQCARTLNDAGIYRKRKAVFGDQEIEMPWCMESFKNDVYKYILEAMTGKKSTEDQTTVNPSDVANVISKQYAENGLICPPWPSYR
jgi:hypothetical protein